MLRSLILGLLSASAAHASNSSYTNPILPGFHPDPSCIFVPEHNNTFFCASSSFLAFPGVPIHASRDLQNWRLISNAVASPNQLPDFVNVQGATSGIWAPALRYHNGTFYITTTLVYDREAQDNITRWDNFMISSTDPYRSDSWSQPVHFDFVGYDTSLFWDTDGTTYVVGSHAYHIRPGIDQAPINLKTGELGEIVNIWNGTGGLAPEGPHIYFKNGWYYLLIAEGGTGLNHEVTMARSRTIQGVYDANPANPVLTNANTTEYFQTVGHADLFPDADGNWWGVALSTRSGPEFKIYPMGRETVLTPVNWDGDWPVFSQVRGEMTGWQFPKQKIVSQGEGSLVAASGKLKFEAGSSLPPELVHWRPPFPEKYAISSDNQLEIKSSVWNLTGVGNNVPGPDGQTFVGRRQVHSFFDFAVDLDTSQLIAEEDEAGVAVYLVESQHINLGVVMLSLNSTLQPCFRLRTQAGKTPTTTTIIPINSTWLVESPVLTLEIEASNLSHYTFSASPSNHHSWSTTIGYGDAASVSYGFTGTLLGVYATTNGRNGSTSARISNWVYRGHGQVLD